MIIERLHQKTDASFTVPTHRSKGKKSSGFLARKHPECPRRERALVGVSNRISSVNYQPSLQKGTRTHRESQGTRYTILSHKGRGGDTESPLVPRGNALNEGGNAIGYNYS